jgi:hypothetical protein
MLYQGGIHYPVGKLVINSPISDVIHYILKVRWAIWPDTFSGISIVDILPTAYFLRHTSYILPTSTYFQKKKPEEIERGRTFEFENIYFSA